MNFSQLGERVLPVVLAALLALAGCGKNQILEPWPEYPAGHLRELPTGQVFPLRVPTYEGSGQAVHPDILWQRDWDQGEGFALAFTPYPDSRDSYENPSLLYGSNGLHFSEPLPGINPLAGKPYRGHNDDTDLVYDPSSGEYRLYYLETCKPDSQNVYVLRSRDLRSWERQRLIHYNVLAMERFILSPAVVLAPSGLWHMYYVNGRFYPGASPIEYLSSPDGLNWDKNDVHAPLNSAPYNFDPWHLDVFSGGDWYYSLVCGTWDEPNLYLGRSRDLIHWEYHAEPILTPASSGLDNVRMYRSSGFLIDGSLAVYFSYQKAQKRWGLGIYKLDPALLWPDT